VCWIIPDNCTSSVATSTDQAAAASWKFYGAFY
jgi:hypothetical protein